MVAQLDGATAVPGGLCYERFAMNFSVSCPRHARAVSPLLGIVFACLLGAVATSGCQTSCAAGNQEVIRYSEGINADSLTYESTPYTGEWLHYPSNRRFVFPHKLGTADYEVQAFIAFNSRPVGADGSSVSDIAIAAGAILIVEQKTEELLQIRNDTCSEQYLYVKLYAHPSESDAGLDL